MAKAANLNIRGIKCDNPKCDYQDMSVDVNDYKNWVNKPCPKCGANLLTQEDLDNTIMLMMCADIVNATFGEIPDNAPVGKVKINMNGTGKMEFEDQQDGKRIILDLKGVR